MIRLPTVLLFLAAAVARGEPLLLEDFATNPIGTRAVVTGSASHFSYSATQDTLTAAYDLSDPHARLTWPLERTLNQNDDFEAVIEFTLSSISFDDFDLGQLSFGFINSANTGSQRTASPGDCWECLAVDYFPAPTYPTLTPTFVRQDDGSGDALTSASLKFPDGTTSLINDFGEVGSLPESTTLTAALSYEAATKMITLRLSDTTGGLAINEVGLDQDDDPSTIQLQLSETFPFEFDAFALLLWHHNDGGLANLTVHSISVDAAPRDLIAIAFPDGVPEPVYENGMLSLTYRRDLTQTEIEIAVEKSETLQTWADASHTVLSAGPGYEIRRVSIPEGFLRFRVDAQ